MTADPLLLTIRQALEKLLRHGAIPGSWSNEQILAFQKDCSEFLGQYGEKLEGALAACDALEARMKELEEALRITRGALVSIQDDAVAALCALPAENADD